MAAKIESSLEKTESSTFVPSWRNIDKLCPSTWLLSNAIRPDNLTNSLSLATQTIHGQPQTGLHPSNGLG